jgi:hypothetical protein
MKLRYIAPLAALMVVAAPSYAAPAQGTGTNQQTSTTTKTKVQKHKRVMHKKVANATAQKK